MNGLISIELTIEQLARAIEVASWSHGAELAKELAWNELDTLFLHAPRGLSAHIASLHEETSVIG